MKTCEWIVKIWATPLAVLPDEVELCGELCDEPAVLRVGGKWYCATHAEKMNDSWQKVDYSEPPDDRCACGWNVKYCVCARGAEMICD